VSDWPYFAGWHYRRHGLGPVRKVFLLWHGPEPIGICIIGYGPLSCRLRNRLFHLPGRMTTGLAARINRSFASVSRLVLAPRYRGAGLAGAFLARVCEDCPWPWIELVSEMANLVPFCEAAGFRLVGRGSDKANDGHASGAFAPGRSAYGRSNWTPGRFAEYIRKVRFSRPAYYLRDNRRVCEGRPATYGSNDSPPAVELE